MGKAEQVARNVVSLVHKGLIKDAFRNDRPEVDDKADADLFSFM